MGGVMEANGEWGVDSYYHNPYLIFIFYACFTRIRLRHITGGEWGVHNWDKINGGEWGV